MNLPSFLSMSLLAMACGGAEPAPVTPSSEPASAGEATTAENATDGKSATSAYQIDGVNLSTLTLQELEAACTKRGWTARLTLNSLGAYEQINGAIEDGGHTLMFTLARVAAVPSEPPPDVDQNLLAPANLYATQKKNVAPGLALFDEAEQVLVVGSDVHPNITTAEAKKMLESLITLPQ